MSVIEAVWQPDQAAAVKEVEESAAAPAETVTETTAAENGAPVAAEPEVPAVKPATEAPANGGAENGTAMKPAVDNGAAVAAAEDTKVEEAK
jgi:hypothetical protein